MLNMQLKGILEVGYLYIDCPWPLLKDWCGVEKGGNFSTMCMSIIGGAWGRAPQFRDVQPGGWKLVRTTENP